MWSVSTKTRRRLLKRGEGMTLTEVKEALYDVIAPFFGGGSVYWAEQIQTKPEPPYVTLKLGDVRRRAFPVTESGERRYHCETVMEINLYATGAAVTGAENATGHRVNTATSDLTEFSAYLESYAATDALERSLICVSLNPPVRDLTGLEHDRAYRYRAMAEYAVTFVQDAGGWYGVTPDVSAETPLPPENAGIAPAAFAETPVYTIEEAEIEEIT